MARGVNEPFYGLHEVQALLDRGAVDIKRPVRERAKDDFKYSELDVHEAIRRLTSADWIRTVELAYDKGHVGDIYTPTLPDLAVKAYVKLYIDDDNRLRVLSFHK